MKKSVIGLSLLLITSSLYAKTITTTMGFGGIRHTINNELKIIKIVCGSNSYWDRENTIEIEPGKTLVLTLVGEDRVAQGYDEVSKSYVTLKEGDKEIYKCKNN